MKLTRLMGPAAITCAAGIALAILMVPSHLILRTAPSRQARPQIFAVPSAEPLAGLPLSFEENRGQTDAHVRFLSHAPGYTLFLTKDEAVFAFDRQSNPLNAQQHALQALHGAHAVGAVNAVASPPQPKETAPPVLRLRFVGANEAAPVTGSGMLAGVSNYFIGRDPSKWRTNVKNFERIRYQDIYPGVDMVFYGNHRQLEYDFVVAPGADPGAIRIALDGIQAGQELSASEDGHGNIVIPTQGGNILFKAPAIYQPGNEKQEVIGRYTLADGQIRFNVAGYDRTRPLVIDPVMSLGTYLGGSSRDVAAGIGVDTAGNIYVAGTTRSIDFPVMNPIETFHNTLTCSGLPCRDFFVTKFNPAGSALVFSTFVGGSNDEISVGHMLALDASNNVYVTGDTLSTDFPVTIGAFQTTFAGGAGVGDAAIFKVNAAGNALSYATYAGGTFDDFNQGIAVDTGGNAYIAGYTFSTDYPVTAGVYQPTCPGTNGSVDCAFLTKLNATGTHAVYSSYFGPPVVEFFAVTVDTQGNPYLTGVTNSPNLPTTPGVFQPACLPVGTNCNNFKDNGFVVKFNNHATALTYCSYLDGTSDSAGYGLAVDRSGNLYVAGGTDSSDFSVTAGAAQTFYGGSTPGCAFLPTSFFCGDAFVTKINPTASALTYSTFLGGSVDEESTGIALDAGGNAYVGGYTDSTNFPLVNAIQATYGGGSLNGFVTKVSTTGAAFAYSTYFGGNVNDTVNVIAVDSAGSSYSGMSALSGNLPTTPGAFQPACSSCSSSFADAFILKISDRPKFSGVATSQHLSGGILTVNMKFTNGGSGNAVGARITAVTFSTITGTGTVTYNSPPLPVNLGNIAQGGIKTVQLKYNVPGTVTMFSATQSLTFKDDGGAALTGMTAQTITP